MDSELTEPPAQDRSDSKASFVEHYIPRGQVRVYAREYKGDGPALVLMHDFPDNLGIWEGRE